MKPLLNRCIIASFHRFCGSTIQRFSALPVLLSAALFLPSVAGAQLAMLDAAVTRSSASGQFIVVGANTPSALPLDADTNAGLVRLDPALLAVSAERIKKPLWRELGIDAAAPWRGRIYLVLHPAESPDENVAIISRRFVDVWGYRVELPDVLPRTTLCRALTEAMLLELANRGNAGDRPAEIPAWLTEGLSQQLLAAGNQEMILSPPDKAVNGLLQRRTVAVTRGVDPLAKVRPMLQEQPALTVEQLSWPEDVQLSGDDGGVYRASAQLFVNNLLKLNHGPEHLRAMLQMLPDYYNWQLAFRSAFAGDFPLPVDLEKWWALQTAGFTAGGNSMSWTPALSSARLDEILIVPVEVRLAPTDLPVHKEVSLQAAIRSLDSNRQADILQAKLRDLGMAQWRMDPQFAQLADAYRRTIANYLGKRNEIADTVGTLDALDAQRLVLENSIKLETPSPKPR